MEALNEQRGKTLLQSILYDGVGYVNERGERTMEICISKDGVVTSCMFADAKQRCNGHRVDDVL